MLASIWVSKMEAKYAATMAALTTPLGRAGLIGRFLRQAVDIWLDSGQNPDGSESPLNRKLTEQLSLAVQNYLDKFRLFHPHLSERGIEIEIALPVDIRWPDFLRA